MVDVTPPGPTGPTGRFAPLGPTDRAAWDALAGGPAGCTEQSSWWNDPLRGAGVTVDALGRASDHRTEDPEGDADGLDAAVVVRSVRIGPVGVADVVGGPMVRRWDRSTAATLVDALRDLAQRRRLVLLRMHRRTLDRDRRDDLERALAAVGARWRPMAMPDDAVVEVGGRSLEEIRAAYAPNHRWSVRRGRERVDVARLTSDEDLAAAYAAFAATRDRQGFSDLRAAPLLIPVMRRAVDEGHGVLLGSRVGDDVVAAAFLGTVGPEVEYLYGGYVDGAETLLPNHVLQDEALALTVDGGWRGYNLGRLPVGAHPGLRSFKTRFGAVARPVPDTIVWSLRPALAGLIETAERRGWDRHAVRWVRAMTARRTRRTTDG